MRWSGGASVAECAGVHEGLSVTRANYPAGRSGRPSPPNHDGAPIKRGRHASNHFEATPVVGIEPTKPPRGARGWPSEVVLTIRRAHLPSGSSPSNYCHPPVGAASSWFEPSRCPHGGGRAWFEPLGAASQGPLRPV